MKLNFGASALFVVVATLFLGLEAFAARHSGRDLVFKLPVIANAPNLVEKKNAFDGMFCARKSWKNPYFNILEKSNKKFSVSKSLKNKIVSRQKAPVTYDHIAAMYIFKSSYIRKAKHIFDGKLKHYELPLNKSIDIDSIEDYELVKKIFDKNV